MKDWKYINFELVQWQTPHDKLEQISLYSLHHITKLVCQFEPDIHTEVGMNIDNWTNPFDV